MKLIKTKDAEGYDAKEIAKELGKEDYQKFLKWHAGQTGEIYGGKFIIYKWDWERYKDGLGPFD